jgi:hypothetical protein
MFGAMGRASGSSRRTQGTLGGRSEQVVRRVLDAAIDELARSGYHGFRMDVVESRAAVNKIGMNTPGLNEMHMYSSPHS